MIEIYEVNTLRNTTADIITSTVVEAQDDGITTFFIAPESSKASVERLIVSLSDSRESISVGEDIKVDASFVNGDAVSFIRLSQRFLQMCGEVREAGSSKTVLRTAIYRILAEHKGEFKTFNKFVGRFEYIDNLIDLLGDFSRYGIDEDRIAMAFEAAEGNDNADIVYMDKLHDFKLLSYYISDLNEKFDLKLMVDSMADANRLMQKLINNPELLITRRYREFATLIKSRFVVVGFGAVRLLTPQEIEFVRNMHLLGAVIRFYPLTGSGDSISVIDDSMYENGVRFMNSLLQAVPDAVVSKYSGFGSDSDVADTVLKAVSKAYAHRIDGDKIFFGDESSTTDAIECVSIAGVDDRIGYIANEIMDLTRNKGYRYKDISIVCIDDSVVNRIKSVLSFWGMDSFIDRKIIISNTPVFRYISHLEVLPIRDYSLEDVLALLRSGLSGVTLEDVDLLENYCIEKNITRGKRLFNRDFFTGGGKYEMKTFREGQEISAAEYLWENVVSRVLVPIRDVAEEIAANNTLDKKAYITAQHVDSLRTTVEALAHELLDRGDSDRASALVRGYKEVMELLTGFTLPINNCEISQKDFCSLIMIDMRNKVQGTIPLMVDSVDIITLEQAYFFPTKIMFVVGATAENFPYRRVNEGLMTRQELERLSAGSGITLPDKVQSRNRSDFVMTSLMLNNVSDKLYFVSEYGIEPSSVYSYYLPFANEEKINCFKMPTNSNGVVQRHDFRDANIDPLYMNEFIGDSMRVSVSTIELYNTCHMRFMAQQILGVKRREDGRRVQTNVMGSIIHHMFETTLNLVNQDGNTVEHYNQLADELSTNNDLLESMAVDAFNRYCEQTTNPNEKTEEFFVFPGNKARRIFKYSFPFILREAANSGYIPDAFERKIQDVSDPLKFTSSFGNEFAFVGSVDRVDHKADTNDDRVVDYKSGAKEIDYAKALAGIQIQLFAYANSLKCERTVTDVGYYPIGLKPEKGKKLEITPLFAGLDKEEFDIVSAYVNGVIQDSCNSISEGKADALVNSKTNTGRSWACAYCDISGACGNSKCKPEVRVEGKYDEPTDDEVSAITERTGKKPNTKDKILLAMNKKYGKKED